MSQPRRKVRRDSLGRRTGRVKEREARLMRDRAEAGYEATEIARELGRNPRTVKKHLGISDSGEPKEKQGNKEVLAPQLDHGVPREDLVTRLAGYRDTLLQWPVPQPDEVVNILLQLRWGRVQPILCEEMEGNEWFKNRERTRRLYLVGCQILIEEVERALEATELMVVKVGPLEPGKTPNFLPVRPSCGGPPEEYLGAAMVAVVVRMMESIYDETCKQNFKNVYMEWVKEPEEFVETRPIFQGSETHLSAVTANSVEEGFLHLWWRGLLVGKVKEATKPTVEVVLRRIAEEQVATTLWLEIVDEYDQITRGLVSSRG